MRMVKSWGPFRFLWEIHQKSVPAVPQDFGHPKKARKNQATCQWLCRVFNFRLHLNMNFSTSLTHPIRFKFVPEQIVGASSLHILKLRQATFPRYLRHTSLPGFHRWCSQRPSPRQSERSSQTKQGRSSIRQSGHVSSRNSVGGRPVYPPANRPQHHIRDKLQDRDGAIVGIRAGLHSLFDLDHLDVDQCSTPKLVEFDIGKPTHMRQEIDDLV